MKKKIFLVIISLVVLTVIGIFLIFYNDMDVRNFVDDENKEEEKVTEEESNDLFGSYYKEADKILSKMSIEEKVGQLFLVRYDNNLVDKYITEYNAGGFILFAKDFQNHTKSSIKSELDSHNANSKLSLAYAVDEEGGYVTRVSRYPSFRSTKFLAPKDYFEQGGYELLESMEKEKAELLKSIGINLNLAPVADVSLSANDFIYNRSFGHDAVSTSEFIKNMVGYANNNGISSCLKHFPGYGNNVDTHTGIAIDNREYSQFSNNDYLPFISGIEEKVPFILVSHNVINSVDPAYPASLSKKVITNELREKLKFSGIVITDDLDMDAVFEYTDNGSAATIALNAGVDMIITSDYVSMYNEVLNGIKNKEIDEEIIDIAARRVLAWKKAYSII